MLAAGVAREQHRMSVEAVTARFVVAVLGRLLWTVEICVFKAGCSYVFLSERAKHKGQKIQERVLLRRYAQHPLEWRHDVAHTTVSPAITGHSGDAIGKMDVNAIVETLFRVADLNRIHATLREWEKREMEMFPVLSLFPIVQRFGCGSGSESLVLDEKTNRSLYG